MGETRGRILFIDQYSIMGGGQAVLLELMQIALSENFELRLLAPDGGELERAVRKSLGERVRFVPLKEIAMNPGRKNLWDVAKLAGSALVFLPHVAHFNWATHVYVNGPRLYLAAALVSQWFSKKFLYHVHLDHSETEKFLIDRVERRARTHKILLSSGYIRDELVESRPRLKESKKLIVLENSLPRDFSQLPFQDRWRDKDKITVVCIGRISREKGQAQIVELAKRLPHLNFVLIGASDFSTENYEQRLRQKAPANLRFYGKTDNLISALAELGAQVSIVPSEWNEPFGLVAIESMACSLLTITSGRGGLKEIAARTGALVGRSTDLLERLLVDLEKRSVEELVAMTRSQHARTIEQYDPGRYRVKWLETL